MKNITLSLAALAFAAGPVPLIAQEEADDDAPSPGQIVEQAAPEEWVAIAADDLLVMDLAPDAKGEPRRVVMQLMPPPFSQGWIRNIRKLAAAKWWDGTSVNRVQDNYVVQWGDADYDNPESGGEAKALPEDLEAVPESGYSAAIDGALADLLNDVRDQGATSPFGGKDSYSSYTDFLFGWPYATDFETFWPVHCYGMVGVGRNLSPDTGTGAELYTVIGHAPRHLDRNIALVGRIIEGMEHLSSLPRGKGQLGFYEDPAKRVPIVSVRLASDLPTAERPSFAYLNTESESFALYAAARANRRDPFFNVPAGGADICNIPVPVRRTGPE